MPSGETVSPWVWKLVVYGSCGKAPPRWSFGLAGRSLIEVDRQLVARLDHQSGAGNRAFVSGRLNHPNVARRLVNNLVRADAGMQRRLQHSTGGFANLGNGEAVREPTLGPAAQSRPPSSAALAPDPLARVKPRTTKLAAKILRRPTLPDCSVDGTSCSPLRECVAPIRVGRAATVASKRV